VPQPFTVESQDGQTPLASFDSAGDLIVAGNVYTDGTIVPDTTRNGKKLVPGTQLVPSGSGSANMGQGITDWINVKAAPYNASGNGTTDDTAAIQAALTALETNGGVLYFPVGTYLVSSSLTYTSTAELHIRGDVMNGRLSSGIGGGSLIYCSPGSYPFYGFDITNAGCVSFTDITVISAANGTTAETYAAFQLTSCGKSNFYRCRTTNVQANQGTNQGIVLNNCNNVDINTCNLYNWINCLYVTGTSADINVRATDMLAASGTGSSTGGVILMDDASGTLHLNNVTTGHGDYGLIVREGGGSTLNEPAFIFINDFEVNNPAAGGIFLDSGGEFWGEQCWISDQGQSAGGAVRHGIVCTSNYQGTFYLHDSALQDWSGHGIWLEGGTGFSITDTTFGGTGQHTTNTYDDIHVAAAVSDVTVEGCHFEVDWAYTMGPNKPRSGVYIESGVTNYHVNGNIFASSGWGTASCVNANSPAQRLGFRNNVHGFDYKDAGSAQSISAISTSETVVVHISTDPQDLLSGATFRFKIVGQYTNGSTSATNTLRARAGTAGTTSDTQVASFGNTSNSSTGSASNIELDGFIQLTSPGPSGSGKAWLKALQTAAGYGTGATTFVTPNVSSWNTTTSVFLTLTFQTSNASNTLAVTMATLEKVA